MRHDPQRDAVYAAEASWWGDIEATLTRGEVGALIAQARFATGQPPVEVRWRGRTARGGICGGQPYIVLPRRYRTRHLLAHELAHAWLYAESSRCEPHGSEWARCYLLLVSIFYSEQVARGLLATFDRFGVETDPLEAA